MVRFSLFSSRHSAYQSRELVGGRTIPARPGSSRAPSGSPGGLTVVESRRTGTRHDLPADPVPMCCERPLARLGASGPYIPDVGARGRGDSRKLPAAEIADALPHRTGG